ncbi:MAG: amidohydrolase family protein, partial [Candidatus Bipolaricaulis sp.]|nr:amidohydrolase family protein [Candidatus Bipolaricaulis sp.]
LPEYGPRTFTQILEQLWWKLDKALDDSSVTTSALIGAMEAARCGVTSLIDHHASPNAIPGSLDRVRDAVCRRVGLRAALGYEVSDRDGEERAALGIEENARFLSTLDPQDRLWSAHFGLHASFTLGDRTLAAAAAAIPDGAGIHIHVAEGPEDERDCVDHHGLRIVERLDRFGLLRPRSILAHCLHVDRGEKDRIAERDAIVVHNPRSNMNNAVGTFDLAGFLDRGVVAGLGTDGLGANLLAELFTAGLAQRQTRQDALAGTFPQLDRLLFRNNPAIVERTFGVRAGRLAPGAAADVAVLDYVAPTPLNADNVLGHLLFGVAVHAFRVHDLYVAGRPILRGGAFVDIDEQAEYARAREEAGRLWKRIA